MNDEAEQILQSFLASLESLKLNIEGQIAVVKAQIAKTQLYAEPTKRDLMVDAMDPDVLGIDTIGRVIKKRKLSPELIEKKRKLMASIRERRLRDIQELKRLRAEKEKAAQKGAPVVAGAAKRK